MGARTHRSSVLEIELIEVASIKQVIQMKQRLKHLQN